MPKWTLRKHFNYLQRYFPLDRPVRLSVCDLGEDAGEAVQDERGYLIRINMEDCLAMQKETLWHEWSHARVGWSDQHQHTDAWGKQYAAIYRKVQDEI